MHKDDLTTDEQRRKLVKLAAGTAALLPLSGLVACSGGDDSDESAATRARESAEEAAAAAKETASEAAEAVEETADEAADTAGEMAEEARDTMDEMAGEAEEAMDDAKQTADDMMTDAKQSADDMMSDAKDAAGDMADKASGEMVAGLPKLQESDPVAQALGYVHDASKVDQSKYAGRGAEANEYCKNCALYVAREGGWGACSIFAGKAVNANGWCASYNRKA